jgi:hypothetical protein
MDMECTSYRDVMLDVLYGEAAPEAAKPLEEHLAVCSACREELAAFRRVRADLGRDALPALKPARAVQRLALWPRALIAAAAAVVLALGAGVARIAQLERRIALQEERHAQDLAAFETALQVRVAPAAVENSGSAALQRFEALLKQSEERQGRVEESLRQLALRTEAQRRYDLARVSAGLAYLDGRTGQHMARTTELMGHVLQASEKK